MTIYLVVVLLLLPSSQGGKPLESELQRQAVSASSPEVCQVHAERLAQAQRAANAELLARTGGRIRGECRVIESNQKP